MDLSLMKPKRYALEQAKRVMLPVQAHRPVEKVSDRFRDYAGLGKFVPRNRLDNEAGPPANDLWSRGTYDGAELKRVAPRGPASMAPYDIPSRGVKT